MPAVAKESPSFGNFKGGSVSKEEGLLYEPTLKKSEEPAPASLFGGSKKQPSEDKGLFTAPKGGLFGATATKAE